MNASQVHGFRKWRGPVAAAVIGVAIGGLGKDLLPQILTELRLRKATELIAQNPVRALQALEKSASAGGVSKRQRARGFELARDAMTVLRGDRPLLRLVGRYVFDPATSARQYFTATHEMMLTFELPASLRSLCPKIRVSTAGADLCEVRLSDDGTTGRGEVPLGLGEAVVADVDLVLPVGAYGTVTTPIARRLHLVQKSQVPSLRLRAGDRLVDLRDGGVVSLQVNRGTPLRVELSDDLGLNDLQWSIDGMAHDPFDWSEDAEASSRGADLPEDLTSQAANRRALELKASNLIRLNTRAVVELLVRDPAVPPIVHARIEKRELKDGATFHAAEKALTLVVTMAKGEIAENLSVVWNGRPQKTHVSGQEVSALLAADVEGARSLVLEARGAPLIRCSIHFDWTSPTVDAVLDPGSFARDLEVRRTLHEAPIGSVVSVTIADVMGLDRGSVEWVVDGAGLEELSDPEPDTRDAESSHAWTRRFRCTESGEARVSVSGSDLAGNRTTIHVYRIRTADPMEERVLTVNGKPFPGAGIIYSSDTRFVVRTEGGIDVDGLAFFVLDPEQQNFVLGQVVLERGDQARTRIGTLDLTFIATSARRVLGVLARNERELVKGEIMIDFAPPTIRVMNLDDAGSRDGLARFFAEPGQRVSLNITDDVGVDVSTISVPRGATIEVVQPGETESGVVLLLPAVFEEPVVVRAADEAKNQGELRFEPVMRSEAETRHAGAATQATRPVSPLRPTPDSGPPPPERAPSMAELSGTPRIVHPILGTFLLVGTSGESSVPPFYIGEHELTVKDWRAFVTQLPGRGGDAGSAQDPSGGRWQALASEAARLLNRNTNVLKKGEDEPLAGATPELVKAYVKWSNEIAHEHGVWKVPTAAQWRLAAGRALHTQAIYPTTALFQNGSDLSNEGSGGALFGRDILAASEMRRRLLQPGAFGLRGMAGSLYEWVVDPQGRLRLIGGSVVSTKDACRLDAPLKSGLEVAEYERGLRLVLLPRGK